MVEQLLERHKTWIEKHRKKYEARKEGLEKRSFSDGETFNILEKEYRLTISQGKNLKSKVEITDDAIFIFEGKNDETSHEKLLEKYLRKAAKEIFVSRTLHFTKLYGLTFKNVTVKDQKSKWGSCSTRGNLNYNWKLIFGPKSILDYIVVHEVCHLKEMNHSDRFWSLVGLHYPEYKEMRRWLRANGHALQNAFTHKVKVG
jgi:predicted metal-dependent hydrolase